MIYDVIVIGAGIVGAFISRELSRYRLNVCLAEKKADVGVGSSKSNSGIIHAGFDPKHGSLKARMNVRGNRLMSQVAQDLDIPFKKIGSLVICFNNNEINKLEELKNNGIKNGVEGLSVLSAEQLKLVEPGISKDAVAALYASSAGIICPYEMTLGAAENAVENGVELKLECEIKSISYTDDRFILNTGSGILESRFLVNAAGLFSDSIAQMAGDSSFTINPRRGQYLLFDKKAGGSVSKVVFQLPTQKGKGVLVTPTVDGNLLIGPNAEEIRDKTDLSTTQEGLAEIVNKAKISVPDINIKDAINAFAGIRAGTANNEFIIAASTVNSKLIHAAGIDSPGLTSAPAIAEMVVELLKESGLTMVPEVRFNPIRKSYVRLSVFDEVQLAQIIEKDPGYGRIVCRCEEVSEAEVVKCIHSTIAARNIDAVKRRTRAGMGRCQGGFCMPRIAEILSRELGVPIEEITKNGGESRAFTGKTK